MTRYLLLFFALVVIAVWSLEAAGVRMGWAAPAVTLGALVVIFVAEQVHRHRKGGSDE